jgi:hypothetical protein
VNIVEIKQTNIISSLIDQQLQKANEDRANNRPKARQHFYASDGLTYQYGGTCPRALTYEFLQEKLNVEPEPIDITSLRTFSIGEHFHDWIQNLLIPTGQVMSIEEFNIDKITLPNNNILYIKHKKGSNRLEFNYNNILITGRIDIKIKIQGRSYVVDIKSIKSSKFNTLETAKLAHILQVQLYMAATGISRGILLYVDKDLNRFKEWVFTYDPIFIATHLVYYQTLQLQYIDKSRLPERPYSKPGVFCNQYCKWNKVCWGGQDP